MKLLVLASVMLLISQSEQLAKFLNCPESVMSNPEFANHCLFVDCTTPPPRMLACGVVGCPGGKKLVNITIEDYSKDYPDCCTQIVCE